jgi:glutamyl-tRNA reductase
MIKFKGQDRILLICISINYKTASIDVRKKLAFSDETKSKLLGEIVGESVSECVLLCTCNRTEIYARGGRECYDDAFSALCRYGGFDGEELAPHVMNFVGDGAVSHLFKTAAGLDSMVVGEDEILRQLKEAYAFSARLGAADGDFNMIFQAAFACAKKIKTDTALSKTSVSIATLAANEAANISADMINVLLIGATGKTGMTVLKNLASHKNISVTAAVRSRGNGFESVKNAPNVRTADYSSRQDFFDSADCIISATSAPHYTVTAQRLKQCIKTEKPRLIIDLAVPPDIDPAVKKTPLVRLIGIDYFEQLAKHNNALKADSARTAQDIIRDETDRLKKELLFRGFCAQMPRFDGMSASQLIYRLKSGLTSEEFCAVLKILENEREES